MRSKLSAIMLSMAFGLTMMMGYAVIAGADTPPVTPVVQTVPSADSPSISNGDFLDSATDAIKQIGTVTKQEGTAKVTIVLTAILIIAQLLIQATKTPIFGAIFSKANGALKLLIVSFCTLLTTALPLLLQGVGLLPTLVSGAVLSAINVFGHQLYQEFFQKSETPATVSST